MEKKIRNLWIKALRGSGTAYRKLGVLFLEGKECRRDKALSRLCLEKAMEMGDERGYFLYHRVFLKGKNAIDDVSYEEMRRDYRKTKDWREKRRLRRYLAVDRRQTKYKHNKIKANDNK